ncbi:Uncharacterised protein [Mycobacteroides abscessus subsp. abscessus]|nr:Uncharacterised protein [Mycobacteroides abscessus subsp. abscessus]
MVATAAGGRAANASSVILGASSIPSQITSRKKYASGGKVRRKVSQGSRTLRTHPTDPISRPSSTPAVIPMRTPNSKRRNVIYKCSTNR